MSEYTVVGKPLPRVDARDKVTGAASYSADVRLPGMLRGKVLRSPWPHARILHVDTSRAERLKGVHAVVTGRDTAGLRVAFVDTPRYPADEPPFALDRVRYIGDEIAAVAAVDGETAEEALRLIRVDHEELPAVFTASGALNPDAPLVHEFDYPGKTIWEDWGARGRPESEPVPRTDNIAARTYVEFGDLDAGFGGAHHVREDRFDVAPVAHAPLEPHAAVAFWDQGGKLNMHVSSMGIFYKRFVLSKALGLPISHVRIHKSYVGGAFGGKIDVFPYEIAAALLSRKSGRPVLVELSREESLTTTRMDFQASVRVKTGVDRNGIIAAQDIQVVVDTGAYRGTGPVVVFLCYSYNIPVYRVPVLRYEGLAVYTNNPVKGPKRGHGAPFIRFAVDSHMDMLAEDLGIDMVELMRRNARDQGEVMPTSGDVLRSCGLKDSIEAAARDGGWEAKRRRSVWTGSERFKRGVGLSACSMFSGSPYYPFASAAVLKLADDGGATLFAGTVEMGQGSETTLSQIAAEELGVPLSDIRIVSGDTELTPIEFGSFLSGGAFVTGKAVRLAAEDARRQLLQMAARLLEADARDLEARDKKVSVKGAAHRSLSYGEIIAASVKQANGDPIIGKGYHKSVPGAGLHPSLSTAKGRWTEAYGFASQLAEVEVDTWTGRVRVLRVVTYHDCGFPLNPQIVEGQIEGCVSMALGQTLQERVDLREGQVFNPDFLTYRMPITHDTPAMVSGMIHSHEPHGPFGAKEVGEGAVSGVMAAVANAVYDAVGARITSLPITPAKVLAALAAAGRDGPRERE
ncbi:MAG: molybdopterin cofactor-binding domain-containing protein [candidate division NC10 bacterium]